VTIKRQEAETFRAGEYSNPADRHRPHPIDTNLWAASTTSIDQHAARSHRGVAGLVHICSLVETVQQGYLHEW